MSKSKRVALIGNECVACGACVKECPLSLTIIFKGMYAAVDKDKCVGCGKCAKACPAGVIQLVERGGVSI